MDAVNKGLKGHPLCEECQCYPEGRNDCPDHLKCREWLRTGIKQGDSVEERLARIEGGLADLNRMVEQFVVDLAYERNRPKPKRWWQHW